MSLFSFIGKAVTYVTRQALGMDKGTKAADTVLATAQPMVYAFLASHKALITAAIDAEADRLKAAKVASAAQVRDRFVAVAQQKAQRIGVPNAYVRSLTVSIDAFVLPSVYTNADGAVDYLATRAKAVVEAL